MFETVYFLIQRISSRTTYVTLEIGVDRERRYFPTSPDC